MCNANRFHLRQIMTIRPLFARNTLYLKGGLMSCFNGERTCPERLVLSAVEGNRGSRTIRMTLMTLIVTLAVSAFLVVNAGAAVPQLINYQGKLTDNSGAPITSAVTLKFRIYDAPAGGTLLWGPESHPVTPDANGDYNVILGAGTPPVAFPANLFAATPRYLGVEVNTDGEMTPRQQITAVAYSLRVATVDGATGGTISGNTAIQSDLTVSGDVGIGTASPAQKLDVAGTAQMTGFKLPTGASNGFVLTSNAVGVGTWLAAGAGSGWSLTGNSGTTPGTNFLGTTDNQALELKVNGSRALRIEPNTTSPNLIGGQSGNSVTSGVRGATIGGGGTIAFTNNQVTDDFGTIGGGDANQAGDNAGTTSDRTHATVGGGFSNTASGDDATVGGGNTNTASGGGATVGGGILNTASGSRATIGGGFSNIASGRFATVGGGLSNTASGDFSFAAGRRAKADHLCTFVWADSSADADFASTADNQFLIRAVNVGIGTNNPANKLDVEGGAVIGATYSGTNLAPTNGLLVEGNVGIGTTGVSAQLDVEQLGATVANFNRSSTDGTLLQFQRDAVTVGSISVAAGVVSYNAFTGSHYAWTDEVLGRGELVTLTGINGNSHNDPESEVIYGIKRSTVANDPACLGSYLALQELSQPASTENPHLVMAVGNGDMWVTDESGDIHPGDYLISSSTPGHAMKDDEAKYPLGYVIARAADPVNWGNESEMVGGHKHKRISVLFESFVRNSTTDLVKLVETQQETLTKQQKEIDELKALVKTLVAKEQPDGKSIGQASSPARGGTSSLTETVRQLNIYFGMSPYGSIGIAPTLPLLRGKL